jgi:hypothetical protein
MIRKPIKQNINTNYRKQNNINRQYMKKNVVNNLLNDNLSNNNNNNNNNNISSTDEILVDENPIKKVSFNNNPEIINDNYLIKKELLEILQYQNSFINMLNKNDELKEIYDDKTDLELTQIIKDKLISLYVRITDKQYFNE